MAVYCANFESVFLYCATEKQNKFEKYLDIDSKRQNRFFLVALRVVILEMWSDLEKFLNVYWM